MRTLAMLAALLALAVQAQAAPIGSRASQYATVDVTMDQYAYKVNTLATYTHASQGMTVYTSPNNVYAASQPTGALNNSLFSVYFLIPQEVIDYFY